MKFLTNLPLSAKPYYQEVADILGIPVEFRSEPTDMHGHVLESHVALYAPDDIRDTGIFDAMALVSRAYKEHLLRRGVKFTYSWELPVLGENSDDFVISESLKERIRESKPRELKYPSMDFLKGLKGWHVICISNNGEIIDKPVSSADEAWKIMDGPDSYNHTEMFVYEPNECPYETIQEMEL